MPDPKKKLNAQQKKKLNSYIDQLAFRNNVIEDYNKKGINIVDKKFQNINFKNDTIVKISDTKHESYQMSQDFNGKWRKTSMKTDLSSKSLDQAKTFDQYNRFSGRETLSRNLKKNREYYTETEIIKFKKNK